MAYQHDFSEMLSVVGERISAAWFVSLSTFEVEVMFGYGSRYIRVYPM
jgi:hypothetical protein